MESAPSTPDREISKDRQIGSEYDVIFKNSPDEKKRDLLLKCSNCDTSNLNSAWLCKRCGARLKTASLRLSINLKEKLLKFNADGTPQIDVQNAQWLSKVEVLSQNRPTPASDPGPSRTHSATKNNPPMTSPTSKVPSKYGGPLIVDPTRRNLLQDFKEAGDQAPSSPANNVKTLLGLQNENGSWLCDENIGKIVSVPNIKEIIESTNNEKDRRLIGTSLVISYLNLLPAGLLESDDYRNMVVKANDWLLNTQHCAVNLPTSPLKQSGSNANTNISVKVVEGTQMEEFFGSYTAYKIEVTMEEYEWTIFRRYRQFFELDTTLKQDNLISDDSMAKPLPPKKAFNNSDKDFVKTRLSLLNDYLYEVIHNPKVILSPSKQLDHFLAPRQVGDIGYDGVEVTLSTLMDEKWDFINSKMRKIVSAETPKPSPPEEAKKTPISSRASVISPATPMTPTTPKKSFWERVFSPSTSQQYVPLAMSVPKRPLFAHRSADDERSRLSWEIYFTEHSYCRSLDIILCKFLDPVRNTRSPHYGVLSDDEIKIIFPVIDELRSFHLTLLKELEDRVTHWNNKSKIGDVILHYCPFFKIYAQYCKSYEKSNGTLVECQKRKEFASFVEEALKDIECTLPDLQSYLIQPVQRLPRLMLILSDLLKKLPANDPDYQNVSKSLDKVKDMIHVANESIKSAEKAFEFWQQSTEVIQNLMEAQRQPLRKGQLIIKEVTQDSPSSPRVHQAAAPCNCFLFNDLFVIITPGNQIFDKLPLELIWVDNTANLGFQVISPERHFFCTLPMDYMEQLKWATDIKKAVEEKIGKGMNEVRPLTYTFRSDGSTYSGDWVAGRMQGKGKIKYTDGRAYEGDFNGHRIQGNGKMTFPAEASFHGNTENADFYDGNWFDCKPHGEGRLSLRSGTLTYEGEWASGKRNGKGTLRDSSKKFTYIGEFKENFFDGDGELKRDDGMSYKGDWKGGVRHGRGVAVHSNFIYDGDWVNDKKEGAGYYTCKNTDESYEGQFKEDERDGQGKVTNAFFTYEGGWLKGSKEGKGLLIFSSGDTYDGEFAKDKKNGEGTFKTSLGEYKGSWKDDVRHGNGTFKHANGFDSYEGQWKEDKYSGQGKLTSVDGCYEGSMLNSMKEGEGMMSYSDGRKYVGNWRRDKRHGRGVFVSSDASKYDGEWKDDYPNGKGISTDLHGKHVGLWKDGKPHGKGAFISTTDNSIFEGDWIEGLRDGKGVLKNSSNGRNVEQTWKQGSLQEGVFGESGLPSLDFMNYSLSLDK